MKYVIEMAYPEAEKRGHAMYMPARGGFATPELAKAYKAHSQETAEAVMASYDMSRNRCRVVPVPEGVEELSTVNQMLLTGGMQQILHYLRCVEAEVVKLAEREQAVGVRSHDDFLDVGRELVAQLRDVVYVHAADIGFEDRIVPVELREELRQLGMTARSGVGPSPTP